MVDGIHNSVVESDVVPLPNAPTGSRKNFAGNAFIVQERTLSDASDGAREYDYTRERRWRIVNPRANKHYASDRAPGYGLGVKGAVAPLLTNPDGWVGMRAPFAKKSLWVVKDVEIGEKKGGTTRMWPSGKYVPQTRKEPEDSIGKWVYEGEGRIEDEDIIIFLTIGKSMTRF